MTTDSNDLTAKVVRAIRKTAERPPERIVGQTKFVEDLEFDSLRMATLSVALEEELGELLLLNDWIADADDPHLLDVDSLVAYVRDTLEDS
jgi:acyl carrier protein